MAKANEVTRSEVKIGTTTYRSQKFPKVDAIMTVQQGDGVEEVLSNDDADKLREFFGGKRKIVAKADKLPTGDGVSAPITGTSKRYSEDQKAEILGKISSGLARAAVCREHGVSVTTVIGWQEKAGK